MTNLVKYLNTYRALCLVIIGIILGNIFIYIASASIAIPKYQVRRDASGFTIFYAEKFAYFHYYTGDFPLATLSTDLDYSQKGAQKEIEGRGEDLIMEYKHWSRLSEHARILAFLPNAYLNGSPENPSIKLFNVLVFVSSLIILFVGFWRMRYGLLGGILVFMINCTPFFLYEVYQNENIFGLLGSLFFMVLGLNLFVLFRQKIDVKKLLITVVITGGLIDFFSEFRNEVAITLLSVLFIYLLTNKLTFLIKVPVMVLVVLSFYGTRHVIRSYFNHKFEKTAELVSQHNGHVYDGGKIAGHKLWHPIFCGLGDFDTKYGYEWDNETVAYYYALPILREDYKMDINYSGELHTDDYYDKDSLYYIKFDEIEAYESVLKDKVITDILNDPLWYLEILAKRFVRILTTTIPVPYVGWLILPLFFYAFIRRKWIYIKLFLVSLPLSATSFIIFSGKGSTYNSVFAYFVILVLISMLLRQGNSIIRAHSFDDSQ